MARRDAGPVERDGETGAREEEGLAALEAQLRLGGRGGKDEDEGCRGEQGGGEAHSPHYGRHAVAAITSPPPMFTKVLVANRGEIAIRVMRTLEELGVASVAVYSEPDREAPHVRRAGEAYLLGPGPAAESYLKVDRILEVARQAGAEAIHPGYGFLAENAAFARACEEAGIVFIGPPADAIDAMGSKTKAREIMRDAGVPIVPGTTDPVETVEDARAVIEESIGYPVAIKAAGGGGGKGFRVAAVGGRAREGLRGRLARGREVLLRRRPSTSSATCPTRATWRCRCSPTARAT